MARRIEASGAQAIWVQHEYGIYGGAAGEHLLALLDRTTLPVIATLHTVLEKPSVDERRVMEGCCAAVRVSSSWPTRAATFCNVSMAPIRARSR
ncbi:hypothetical protein P0F65_18770 [Sphingomonas sp. I4]